MLIRIACLFILLLVSSSSLAHAQTATPAPETPPITLGETVTGTLPDTLAKLTYRFTLPPDQDVMMAMDADAVVIIHYCIEFSGAGSMMRDCPVGGGGGDGSDYPVSQDLFIPNDGDPATQQNVEVSVSRPLDGAANFSLTIYPITQQTLVMGEDTAFQPDADQPYQVYILPTSPNLPFTVVIEDAAADGNYLWAAHQPYRAFVYTQTGDPTPISPHYSDGASNDAGHGVQSLSLSYVGDETFRVVVKADDAYTLHSTAIGYQPVDVNTPTTITLSYRDPLRVLRLTNTPEDAVNITVTLKDGVSVIGDIYTAENPYGRTVFLGNTADPTPTLPLSETAAFPPSSAEILVVLQVPSVFSRDSLEVEVQWESS